MLAVSVLLLATAMAPPTGALNDTKEGVASVTVLVLGNPAAGGCAAGAVVAVAAMPGQPQDEQRIAGCGLVVAEKPAAADVQLAIKGGGNNVLCDWRPLAFVNCSGAWVHHGGEARLQLAIRGGSPGAVTAVAL